MDVHAFPKVDFSTIAKGRSPDFHRVIASHFPITTFLFFNRDLEGTVKRCYQVVFADTLEVEVGAIKGLEVRFSKRRTNTFKFYIRSIYTAIDISGELLRANMTSAFLYSNNFSKMQEWSGTIQRTIICVTVDSSTEVAMLISTRNTSI